MKFSPSKNFSFSLTLKKTLWLWSFLRARASLSNSACTQFSKSWSFAAQNTPHSPNCINNNLAQRRRRLPGEGVEKLPGGGFWVPLSSQVGKLCVWPSLRKLFRLLVIGLTEFCQSIKHVWGMGDWEGETPVSWWESRFLCNGKREIVPLNWKFPKWHWKRFNHTLIKILAWN